MSTQPQALRLADYLTDRNRLDLTCDEAAAELRRLYAVNQELLKALAEPVEYAVEPNGKRSSLLTHMMNKRSQSS